MANRRRVRKTIAQLRRVKTWQLVLLLILGIMVSATFLRLNNIGMMQRYNAVLAADKANTIDVAQRLKDLRNYVASHMNTSVDRLDLVEQYKRDASAAIKKAQESNDTNGNVMKKASEICDPQFPGGYSYAYQSCILNEQSKYAPAGTPTNTTNLPNASVYSYSFASPFWSFDWAGASLVVCLVIILMIIARAMSLFILKILLKKHYKGL